RELNYAFSLPGIWIDDADNGENRFWIFPSNYQMAFCYYLNENALELIPYEFSILSDGDISENDICVIITPEGNEKIITDGITPNDQAVYADFDVTLLEDSESIVEVSLTPLNRKVGYWFDWNKFTKLDKTDNRYSKFLEIIIEHYSSNEMKVVSKVKCDYTWMINIDSALVAIDNDYLYVAKPPQNLYFYLTKTDDDEFQYVHKKVSEGISGLSLLKPSSQNPIYLIRRKDSQYERFDSYFVTQNEEVRAEYERFKEVVINTNIDDQITFYDVMRHGKFLQRICFNRYSRMFDLNQMLKHYGVKKLTSITMEIRD
ncbi:MAG: hypothetical protein K2N34_04150, partial [Lachnospiraceae bacterium]|nr:hypothetical protein [Lachnospiraceae bacterium]